MKLVVPFVASCLFLLNAEISAEPLEDRPTPSELRTWTDATGKFTVKARLIGNKDGKVNLERADGKTAMLPILRLSKADQAYVREIAQREEEASIKKGIPKLAEPLESTFTNSVGMKLIWIPAGTFSMGSPSSERYRGEDEQQHQVTLSEGFYLGTTEVTQGQWKAVMKTTPWMSDLYTPPRPRLYVEEREDNPAVEISWDDAVKFCRRLSAKTKKTYRLPTEAEWEYACRAGTTTSYSFGDDASKLVDYGWFGGLPQSGRVTISAAGINGSGGGRMEPRGNAKQHGHEVGHLKANPFGLYDMHGNVLEWCSDRYSEDYYAESPKIDPTGAKTGPLRVLRGGPWSWQASNCRSANRHYYKYSFNSSNTGFGVAVSP